MTYLKPALAVLAAMSLSACLPGETKTTISTPGAAPVVVADGPEVAPAAPIENSGDVQGADSLNGTWNLVKSQCGDAKSKGSLKIDGRTFTFPTATCTATNSQVQSNYTSTTLGCSGAPNRQVNISIKPGIMRLNEDSTTLTYYRCM